MNFASVRRAYDRHASYYDIVFGPTLGRGRRLTVERANRLPGARVLDVGAGTGLSLPLYARDKQVIAIDAAPEMLQKARRRVAADGLAHVKALLEMDAEQLAFADDSFDIVVAMYVVSVVPDPARLMAEMSRVCVAGGHILILNHFAHRGGLRGAVERGLVPLSSRFNWRPDLAVDGLINGGPVGLIESSDIGPLGLITLVHCRNAK